MEEGGLSESVKSMLSTYNKSAGYQYTMHATKAFSALGALVEKTYTTSPFTNISTIGGRGVALIC